MQKFSSFTGFLAFWCVVTIFSAFIGGHIHTISNYLALMGGFSVNQVIIRGNKHISEIDVLSALELDEKTSMIGFDAEKARKKIAAFSWIATVSIQKLYPDRLEIFVKERTPLALWQREGRVDVIDGQGHSLTPYTYNTYRAFAPHSLPLFIGSGAEFHAANFLEQIQAFPAVYTQARAYIRVAERRWDILLANGMRIQLPENNAFECLSEALNFEGANVLLSRAVEKIDLRVAGRIIVSLAKDSVLVQETMLSDQKCGSSMRKVG